MPKLFDSLTGYFFSGESDSPAGGPSATRTAAVAREPEGDSADEPGTPDPVSRGGTVAPRLRDRLLRRTVYRTAEPRTMSGPSALSTSYPNLAGTSAPARPWGDAATSSPRVHPLAVIDPRAELAADVEVGPFCVVGPHVVLGPGCRLHNNVTILGYTTVGSDNEFFPNCVIGAAPQDKKFAGDETRLVIGDGNVFREAVTLHLGTPHGGGVTRVGDRNLLMVNAHVGHDVTIGNDCVIANNAMLAGHCVVGNRVSMMGGAALHHFVSVGDFVFVGGFSRIHHDVPPFVKVDGADEVRGVNVVGLRRGGVGDDDIAALEVVGRRLFVNRKVPMSIVMAEFLAKPDLNPRVRELIDFLRRRNLGTKGRYLESLRHR